MILKKCLNIQMKFQLMLSCHQKPSNYLDVSYHLLISPCVLLYLEKCSSLTYFIIARYESEHIKEITTVIANRILNFKSLFVEDNLVGMDSHFQKLSLGLRMESNDVRMV